MRKYFFSFLIALAIASLSLSGSDNFKGISLNIPYLDKLVHAGMYFVLMISLFVESREKNMHFRKLSLMALIPFLYGVAMEILQHLLTSDRTASFFDALFNTAGIMIAVIFIIAFRPIGFRLK